MPQKRERRTPAIALAAIATSRIAERRPSLARVATRRSTRARSRSIRHARAAMSLTAASKRSLASLVIRRRPTHRTASSPKVARAATLPTARAVRVILRRAPAATRPLRFPVCMPKRSTRPVPIVTRDTTTPRQLRALSARAATRIARGTSQRRRVASDVTCSRRRSEAAVGALSRALLHQRELHGTVNVTTPSTCRSGRTNLLLSGARSSWHPLQFGDWST